MKTIKTTCSMPREPEALRFYEKHEEEIIGFGSAHWDKLGYVSIHVNGDYRLTSKRFIKGKFNRWDFKLRGGSPDPWKDSTDDIFPLFYEIYFVTLKWRFMFCKFNFRPHTIVPSLYNPQ